MSTPETPVEEVAPRSMGEPAAKAQVRGSVLLLAGRGCSIAINLVTQVLMVRYLSKLDFGALAYALSSVELGSMLAAFSMDKAVAHFAAVYHERQDQDRFVGALALAAGVVLGFGTLLVGLMLALPASWIIGSGADRSAWSLVVLLAALVPANAFGSVAISLFTVLKGARSVFLRKHLLGPLLKLLLIVAVMLARGSVYHLAASLVLAGLIGLVTDGYSLIRAVRLDPLLQAASLRRALFPVREFMGYALPQMGSDLAFLARGALIVILLGWLGSAESAGTFRAIAPVVRLNQLVLENFWLMFAPLAARLTAAGEWRRLTDLYGRASTWTRVLSFPAFAVCVALAEPLTVQMFGPAYADGATPLVILACGYYIQSSFGLNAALMKVLGRHRWIAAIDVLSAAASLVLASLLIPRWEAAGAALAVSIGMTVHTLLKWGLVQMLAELPAHSPRVTAASVITAACSLAVLAGHLLLPPGWLVGLSIAAAASLIVLWANRDGLDIETAFPEVRLPWFLRTARRASSQPDISEDHGGNGFRVAYMMSRFPKLTETFVLYEMREMERLGVRVEVVPLQRERTKVVHAAAQPFVDRALFTPWLSAGILAANAREFACQPVRYLDVLWTLVRANFGSLRYLTGALLFFPKAVYLSERLQKAKIDHLHAHFASHPAAVAYVIHRLAGIPYSFTAHGSDLHRDRHMLREKVAEAAEVITISEYNRRLIVDECSDQDLTDKLHVVHCGVDLEDFRPREAPTPWDMSTGPFQALCVGTLHEVKGQRYLIEACAELQKRGISVHCRFIGEGPDRTALEQLTARLGVQSLVTFLGRKTTREVREFLGVADVLVAPSVPTHDGRREGIPVVLMEALACGVPAIASDLSGIPELVRHGQTGLLAPPGDVGAIADALQRMVEDAALRRSLATAGLQLVREEFNLATNAQRLRAIFCSTRPRPDESEAPDVETLGLPVPARVTG